MRNPSVCFPAGILLILMASLVPFTNSFVTPLHKASFQVPCKWNWQGGVPTKVEDGSPLGVAIVALGSFLFLGDSGDAGDTVKTWVGDDLPVAGVILVTASVAAGISRLVRRQLRR